MFFISDGNVVLSQTRRSLLFLLHQYSAPWIKLAVQQEGRLVNFICQTLYNRSHHNQYQDHQYQQTCVGKQKLTYHHL